jgi:Cu/Ag efflux protein CusF
LKGLSRVAIELEIFHYRGKALRVSKILIFKEDGTMKRILVPMLAVMALSWGLTLFAAQEPKQEPGAQETTPQLIDATILQVDTAGNSVTVETTDKRKGTLTVDSQTKITVSGKKAELSDLKQGQQAKIAFNGQGKALSIDA